MVTSVSAPGALSGARLYGGKETVSLQRNAEFPDLSEKWTGFAEPMLAD